MKTLIKGNKRFFLKVIWTFLHSIILTLLALIFLNIDFIPEIDNYFIRGGYLLDELIPALKTEAKVEDYLFINTSYDKQLRQKSDSDGFNLGNIAISDRSKLIELLDRMILLRKTTKPIFLNIKDISISESEDSVLLEKINNFNAVIPDCNSGTKEILHNVKYGFTSYGTMNSDLVKYRILINDTIKSVPLLMYEAETGIIQKKGFGLDRMNNNICVNLVIPELSVRQDEIGLVNEEKSLISVDLRRLLLLPDSLMKKYIEGRIIIIASLNDEPIYNTLFGEMPESVFLFNVYLTLKNRGNLINIGFVLFLIIFFFLGITLAGSKSIIKESVLFKKMTESFFGRYLVKLFGYIVIVGLFSLIMQLIYGHQLNIILLSFYLNTYESIIRSRKQKDEKQ